MSSISSLATNQLNCANRLFTSSSAQNTSKTKENEESSGTANGLTMLMNCLGSPQTSKTSTSFETYATSSLDSGTMSSLVQAQEAQTGDRVTAMDSDGDGTITQDEFVASRPDDVTEEMATNLWNSFDTEGVGSLSTDDLTTAMSSGMQGPPPPPPMEETSTTEDTASTDSTSSSDSVSAMDTNGDGYVSESEFLAAKPGDVTDEMAQNLWDSFDTEDTGSLSTSDLATAMASNAPKTDMSMFAEASMAYGMSSFYGQGSFLNSAVQSYA